MTNVGYNFGKKIICQVCELPGSEDNQKHAFTECHRTKPDINCSILYQDIFSSDLSRQCQAAKVMNEAYRKRVEIIEGRKDNQI